MEVITLIQMEHKCSTFAPDRRGLTTLFHHRDRKKSNSTAVFNMTCSSLSTLVILAYPICLKMILSIAPTTNEVAVSYEMCLQFLSNKRDYFQIGIQIFTPLIILSNFLIKRIEDVEDVSTEDLVFDTYPQVVAKLKEFDME